MTNGKRLTALLQFDGEGNLLRVLPGAATDKEYKAIKKALSRLIKPSLWNRVKSIPGVRIWIEKVPVTRAGRF